MKNEIFDSMVLGGGPAGLSAALYCARGGLKTGIVDISAFGGAPVNYCEIENYLGFSKIKGYELCEKFENHIDDFKIQKFPYEEISSVDLISDIKSIKTINKKYWTKTVIIATGAKPKHLGIKGEAENIGTGVSYCAVCDGSFYKGKIAAVIGGGNSALEEAMYLTNHCKKVYIVHRRDTFRADEIIQKKARDNKKIEFVLDSVPVEILSNERVYALKIKNTKTNDTNVIYADGIFPYVGLTPNSEMFRTQLQLDKNGFIITDNEMKTSQQGVYAIGDVRNTPLRQVITAVADGAVAGVQAANYLLKIPQKQAQYS